MHNPRYRICYANGNPTTGTKIYELYKYCKCEGCKYRLSAKREPSNYIAITTKDVSKVGEISDFLERWECKDGWIQVERTFLEWNSQKYKGGFINANDGFR